jgi:indolepyruvate ferredoxin oxidoreductase beta subunit
VNGVSTVALAGVGGQGILLAATIVAQAAMAAGFEVKTSEVHGMAQRGGSVVSTVRYGKQVWSPVAPRADLVIATETLEGRRALGLLADKGTLVYATTVIAPGSVLRGERAYPDDLAQAAQARLIQLIAVDAEALGREAGSVRAANVALVGAATHALPFASSAWERALELAVPDKMLELNRRAFALGREAATATVAATEEGS